MCARVVSGTGTCEMIKYYLFKSSLSNRYMKQDFPVWTFIIIAIMLSKSKEIACVGGGCGKS